MTKLTKNYSSHANNLLNVTIQSHSCCNQKRTHLIVTTINPILCRPCVHPSTFPKVLIDKFCSSKCREIIIFVHNYFRKTQTNQTNQASHHLDFYLSIFFLVKGLGNENPLQSMLTLIVQTAVSAVLGTFSEQPSKEALKVSWCIFC